MLQQLPAALAGSTAIGAAAKDPEPPAKGLQKQSPSNINCPNTTFARLHPSVSSQRPTGSLASGAGPDLSCGTKCGPSPPFHPKSQHAKQLVPFPPSQAAPPSTPGKQRAMADEGTAARSSEPPPRQANTAPAGSARAPPVPTQLIPGPELPSAGTRTPRHPWPGPRHRKCL